MDWNIAAAAGCTACFAAGIYFLKGGSRSWTLQRRAYLRNGIGDSFTKYRSWESFLESRQKGDPFEKLFRRIKIYREKKVDREIFESITFLRNMASLERGRNCSTDDIVEKLSEHNGLLQPIFIRMLHLLRINQPKEAAALFSQKAGTQAGKDFAGLLIQWDSLEPGELLETLLSYEKSMKAARLTDQKRRDEIISELIYLPVVVHILVIFINFIYVAYFLDQREMLQMFL